MEQGRGLKTTCLSKDGWFLNILPSSTLPLLQQQHRQLPTSFPSHLQHSQKPSVLHQAPGSHFIIPIFCLLLSCWSSNEAELLGIYGSHINKYQGRARAVNLPRNNSHRTVPTALKAMDLLEIPPAFPWRLNHCISSDSTCSLQHPQSMYLFLTHYLASNPE